MLNEYIQQESQIKQQLTILEKQSDVLYTRLIKQGKWLEDNGYVKPYDNLNDLNIFKFHKLAMELKAIEREICGAKDELLELKSDIYFMEAGTLISQYAKAKYKIKQIDNNNHNIEIIFADDYHTYINNDKVTTIVYELVTRINALPYEKIVCVREG